MSIMKLHTVFRMRCKQINEISYLTFYKTSIRFDTSRGIANKVNNEEASNEVPENVHSTEVIRSNNTRGYPQVPKDVNSIASNVNNKFNETVTEMLNKHHVGSSNTLLHEHSSSVDNSSKYVNNNNVPETSNKVNSTLAILDADDNSSYDASGNVNNNILEISNVPNSITLIDKCDFDFDDALKDLNEERPGPLDKCTEDLSHIGPYMTPTYNLAKFADDSTTIQQLVKLGVELYKLEKDRDVIKMILTLDFDKDMKPYITFFNDCGVLPENLGKFITKNPKIFKEDLEDLHTRIRYLIAHNFSHNMIESIVNRNPLWLSFKTQEIDERLGHFQNSFKLSGSEVRYVATKCPRLITYNMRHIKENFFCVKEEMGFSLFEMKYMLKEAPRIWMLGKPKLLNTFDYAHNQMNIPHELIRKQPKTLSCRKRRLQERHQFLVKLNKNQYDPLKPQYISLTDIISGSDLEFCQNVAKASINTFNLFLKTI